MKNIIPIEQFLFESKSSAKKRFLDRGLISDEVFNHFLEIDTTPTKKFTEKMCEFFVGGSSQEEISLTFSELINLKIKIDINDYTSLQSLKDFIEQNRDKKSRKTKRDLIKQDGSKVVFKNDKIVILSITTEEASCIYGKGTTWCISGDISDNMFLTYYQGNLSTFYFLFDYTVREETNLHKIAIEITRGQGVIVYNAIDVKIDKQYMFNVLREKGGLSDREISNILVQREFTEDDIFAYKNGIVGTWSVNENGELDVNGYVHLVDRALYQLPNRYGKVTDGFDCSWNNLTTLEGCPYWVGGDFSCKDNMLKTLEFAPYHVGLNFECSNNDLDYLDYAPEYVGGDFSAYNQKSDVKFKESDVRDICEVDGYIHV